MEVAPSTDFSAPEAPHAWQPLSSIQRRVAGVLVEKAKTTPDGYPMTVSGITTACNQKSNRAPQTNFSMDEVQQALDELRAMGAVTEIQGGGRVAKFRHLLYDWLGVTKVELAVMAELMLRGEQTVGDLRGRAARMEPIKDLAELMPVVKSLEAKGLVIALTPEGRGQMVTHGLYRPREMDELKVRCASRPAADSEYLDAESRGVSASSERESLVHFQQQLDELKSELAQLRAEWSEFQRKFS